MPIILFICYVLFSITGLLLIKIGGTETSAQISLKLISVQVSSIYVLGLVCYVTSFLLFILLVQKMNLSYLMPIGAGIVNVAAVLLGAFVLKEKIHIRNMVGIAFVLIGVFLITMTEHLRQ